MINPTSYIEISTQLSGRNAVLVAVSKTKPSEDILGLYALGQKDFGENYVQELVEKQVALPKDIRWHFIGHLQGNKVKMIAPFVSLIHAVDSLKLLQEIDKQAKKNNRIIDCLLQVHIAEEETKFGFDSAELLVAMDTLTKQPLQNIRIRGLMGMASFSDDREKVRGEFRLLKNMFDQLQPGQDAFSILSMGMSADYAIALEEGSTMVRIGSLLFGNR